MIQDAKSLLHMSQQELDDLLAFLARQSVRPSESASKKERN